MEIKGYYGQEEIIAGLDLSLRSTGVVIIDSSGSVIHEEIIRGDKIKGLERLKAIKDRIIEVLKKYKVTKIAIEGFSFGSRGRATFDIGGLGWVIRLGLYESGYEFVDISPSSLKSFIVKGNADKIMMIEAVLNTYGVYYKNDNLCDAYSLARMLLALGDDTEKYSEKGGAKKLQTLRKNLEKRGIKLI